MQISKVLGNSNIYMLNRRGGVNKKTSVVWLCESQQKTVFRKGGAVTCVGEAEEDDVSPNSVITKVTGHLDKCSFL